MPRTSQKPTIRQVALACNVSPMTVSAVLNNKSSEVGKDTRERVLKAVREMGYRPTAAVPPPGGRQVPIYGVVTAMPGSSLTQPGYYSSVLNGLLTKIFEIGHNVLLFSNDAFQADVQQSIRLYCDGRCDGLLIIAPPPNCPLVLAVRERGVPFVVIGSTGDAPDIPSVDVNNTAEASQLTEYLIAQGHRRIAFLGDPRSNPDKSYVPYSATQRQAGYEQALLAHDIILDSAQAVSIGGNDTQTYQQTVSLLRRPVRDRPTALFCWHDFPALAVFQAVHDLGLRIPDDVSVVGFDDDPRIAELEPSLTTVRQPYLNLGEAAVEMLREQVQSKRLLPLDRPRVRCFLPAEIIHRSSVAAPASEETTDPKSEPQQ